MISWREDLENIPKNGEPILIYSHEHGVNHVEWRMINYGECGYSEGWKTWCIVGTDGVEFFNNDPIRWSEINYPTDYLYKVCDKEKDIVSVMRNDELLAEFLGNNAQGHRQANEFIKKNTMSHQEF